MTKTNCSAFRSAPGLIGRSVVCLPPLAGIGPKEFALLARMCTWAVAHGSHDGRTAEEEGGGEAEPSGVADGDGSGAQQAERQAAAAGAGGVPQGVTGSGTAGSGGGGGKGWMQVGAHARGAVKYGLSAEDRAEVGALAKWLLDAGRVEWLKARRSQCVSHCVRGSGAHGAVPSADNCAAMHLSRRRLISCAGCPVPAGALRYERRSARGVCAHRGLA